jgi:hypothetical protein
MKLDGRQAEFLCNLGVADLSSLIERQTLDPLGHERRAGDGRATAECLEHGVLDDTLQGNGYVRKHKCRRYGDCQWTYGFVDPDLKFHDIATWNKKRRKSASERGKRAW